MAHAFLAQTRIGHTYAPRDVANAPQIKVRILARSAQRGDACEIAAWMGNHFYRHIIANFLAEKPALTRIHTLKEAQTHFNPGSLPDWIAARLAPTKSAVAQDTQDAQPLWWIAPDSAALLALEAEILEFLTARQGTALEGKLQRITCPQALLMSRAEHAAFAARKASGWRTHKAEATRLCWQGREGVFLEFLPQSRHFRAEMAFESQMMRHCLGQFADRHALTGGYGEQYANACEEGRLRLFSYRTSAESPRITLSAEVTSDGRLNIEQIKGKQNRPPIARYQNEVRDFLNTLTTTLNTPQDALFMNLICLPSGWQNVADIDAESDQMYVITQYPELIIHLPHLSRRAQWLALAKQPKARLVAYLDHDIAQALM